MTVTNPRRSVTHNGNGVTTVFPVANDGPIYFLNATELVVTLIDADGTETRLMLGAGYSVSGAGNPSGGSVTTVTPPGDGQKLRIERLVPLVQPTQYPESTKFPAASHERALDRLTMVDQQQQEDLSRAPKFPKGAGLGEVEIRPGEAGKVLGWGPDGNIIPLINSAAEAEVVAEEVRDLRQQTLEDKEAAQQARSDASDFAGAASEAASSANTDANRAELAAGNAFVNANVYENVAAGLAATTSGQQFQVQASTGSIRYRNASGSAIEVARYPDAEIGRLAEYHGNANQFSVDTASSTITITGGRVISSLNTTFTLVSQTVDFSAVSGSSLQHWLVADVNTRMVSYLAAVSLASLSRTQVVIGSFIPSTGAITGFPRGYTLDGAVINMPNQNGIFYGSSSAVVVNSQAKTISFTGGRIVSGSRSHLMNGLSLSYDGLSSAFYYLVYNPKGSVRAVTSSALPNIVESEVVFGQFEIAANQVNVLIGLPNGYTLDGGIIEGTTRMNYGLALSIPERWNFNFASREIEITGAVQVLYNGFRVLISPQTVDISHLDRNLWNVILVHQATGEVSVAPVAASYDKSKIVIGAWREDIPCVAGIENFSINSAPFGGAGSSSGAPSPSLLGWPLPATLTAPAMPGYRTSDPLPLAAITSSHINGWYDDLVTANPGYITRTLLGNELGDGLPIYAYHFKPDRFRVNTNPVDYPQSHVVRIMIQSGIHPEEMSYVYAYHLMELITNHWQDDETLEALRWGVEWQVIPALNPWGIDNHERSNSRGVDINRNYPIGWVSSSDPEFGSSGSGPLSEVETQCSYGLLTNFKPHIAFDCHNIGAAGADVNFWMGSVHKLFQSAAEASMNALAPKWQRENAWMPNASMLGYVQPGNPAGTSARSFVAAGAVGGTFETAPNLYYEPGGVNGSPLTVRYSVEALATHIIQILRKLAA